jgi:methylated-DNA-[protein]-cysteine S-methyltransferase
MRMGKKNQITGVNREEELIWTSCTFAQFHADPVFLMATEKGLCRITWPEEGFEALLSWRDKHMPHAVLRKEPERMEPYLQELREYLNGSRKFFTISLDLRGTEFQQAVWRELLAIPYGSTVSYSELALRAGRPVAVRACGAANGSNPVPLVVPCHRAIGKNGALTGFRGGLTIKAELLRMEGASV